MIETGGAAIPQIVGVQSLARYFEWLSLPFADPAGAVWSRGAMVRGSGSSQTGAIGLPWNLLGGQGAIVNTGIDNWRTILFRSAAAADCTYFFDPNTNTGGFIDFQPTFPPNIGSMSVPPSVLAVSLSAWIRKQTAGGATSSRQTFGWFSGNATSTSGGTARAGLIGDGVLGFQFGSVNCPDSSTSAPEGGASDIDAGSIQPAGLVNPAAKWFHVRIKIIPPTPAGSLGRWAAYLNGRLIKVFDQEANFPRRTGLATVAYARSYPFIGVWRMPVLEGIHVHDLRVWLEDDLLL